MSNVIDLPPSERDLLKDSLINDVHQSILALQKFINIHSISAFTKWDETAIEESSDRLLLTFETLRRHGK